MPSHLVKKLADDVRELEEQAKGKHPPAGEIGARARCSAGGDLVRSWANEEADQAGAAALS